MRWFCGIKEQCSIDQYKRLVLVFSKRRIVTQNAEIHLENDLFSQKTIRNLKPILVRNILIQGTVIII